MAEPLGEQPIGSEVSSRPALRTYFVVGFLLREPQSTSANFLGNAGEGEGRARFSPRRRSDPCFVDYA